MGSSRSTRGPAGRHGWTAVRRWTALVGAVVVLGAGASAAYHSPPGGYTVRPGDTVDGIAARFGVTPVALATANRLADPDFIEVGQQLQIPGLPTPTAVPPARPGGRPAPVKPAPPLAAVPTPSPGRPLYPGGLVRYPARLALRAEFRRWGRAEGISPGLLEAVAWMESGWQAGAVSSAGAVGVAQIEPTTARFISHELLGLPRTLDSRVASDNIEMEAAYLRFLLHQTHGEVANAVGGYYQGLTALLARGPLPSTRAYVSRVGQLWSEFHSG